MSNKTLKFYTPEENAIILGSTASQDKEIAAKLGRTPGAISVRRSALLRAEVRTDEDQDEDFTLAEQRKILDTPYKEQKALANDLGTTLASVRKMRQWLGKNGLVETRIAASPAVKRHSHSEEATSTTHIMLKFGGSSMLLRKDEVSVVEVGSNGIRILK